jgi:hypothetical protein
MHEFLNDINGEQFRFDRDFVLKTAMVLLNQPARYDVEKFRTPQVRQLITDQWSSITDSIRFVRDFISEKTFVRCDKALPSYLALIPLIYYRYHYPDGWNEAKGKVDYLLRVLLTGAFSGRPDSLIDQVVGTIKETRSFQIRQIFGVIREDSRNLAISEAQLFDMGYGSRNIHLLFNLWHPRTEYAPSWDGHLPQVDHIFPRSILKKVKELNPENGRTSLQYYSTGKINQFANCMLLTQSENGPAGKGDMSPSEWFKDKSDAYLALHCIPRNNELWEIGRYEDFIEARSSLIKEKFKDILYSEDEV